MHGRDVETLKVFLDGSEVFAKSKAQGNSWIEANVRLPGSGLKKVNRNRHLANIGQENMMSIPFLHDVHSFLKMELVGL